MTKPQRRNTVKNSTQVSQSNTAKLAADREPPKQNDRPVKKTVHNIAPSSAAKADYSVALEKDPSMDNDTAFQNGREPVELPSYPNRPPHCIQDEPATDFACALMALALKFETVAYSSDSPDNIETSINQLLDEFEHTCELAPSSGNAVQRLQALLHDLHRGAITIQSNNPENSTSRNPTRLANAIHSVLSSLSTNGRISEAIERSSQRAIYQFAYGLTHEINNPLANIAARAQQLIANVSTETDKRSLATIVDQAMRAHEMLAEMMRVVQPRKFSLHAQDVVSIARQAATRQLSDWEHAKIQCDLKLSPTSIFGIVNQAALTEAISAIVQNALQVCRPGDRIEILCHEVEHGHSDFGPLDGSTGKRGAESDEHNDRRIRLAIRDTGPGMSPETLERAWDLYFSGREHGRGLGISLANVRQILDAHRGHVWIESAPNAGCAVEIRLPRVPTPAKQRGSLTI